MPPGEGEQSVVVEERFPSREFSSLASPEINYIASGSDEGIAIKNAVLAFAPAAFDGIPLADIETEQLSNTFWHATARYGAPSGGGVPPQTGESVFSFDTGGGTQHITQSKETVASHGRPGDSDIPDFQGAIGVNADGVPEGVDIAVPVYNFSETHYVDDADIDDSFKAAIFNRTGKVNDDSFRGFSPGEVLLLGASGSKRGSHGDWELTYRFSALPNASGLTLGDITGIDKKGWEFLWVRYEEEVVTIGSTEFRVTRPRHAFVERVYDEIDFAGLQI